MHTQLLHIVHFLGVQALADINSCDVPVIFGKYTYRLPFVPKLFQLQVCMGHVGGMSVGS